MLPSLPKRHVVWNCLELFGSCCGRLSQHGVGEVLRCNIAGGGMLSVFALAVNGFVTIGRRTAQFCFGLLVHCFWAPPRFAP